MAKKVFIELEVQDNGSVTVKKFNKTVQDSEKKTRKWSRTLGDAARRMGSLGMATAKFMFKMTSLPALLTTVGTLFAGWKLKQFAQSFIDVGSSMDTMRLSLDTITKGSGDEWFERLNQWALKMPVNTAKAIQAFTGMRAMGLEPTIKDMTTLVDTTSALGGSSDTLMGISQALGQIKTKGRVSTEELLQLAERGVPAFQILQEKLGLTNEQLGNIGKQGLDANQTIAALIEGMEERFGGQSEKIQDKWAGLTESLKSYWTEFQRLVMESGVMAWLEENLKAIVDWVDEMNQSGQLKVWAAGVADAVVKMGEKIKAYILAMIGDWRTLEENVSNIIGNIGNWIDEFMPKVENVVNTMDRMMNLASKALPVGEWVAEKVEIAARGWSFAASNMTENNQNNGWQLSDREKAAPTQLAAEGRGGNTYNVNLNGNAYGSSFGREADAALKDLKVRHGD